MSVQMTSTVVWTQSRRLGIAATFAVVGVVWWYISEPLFDSGEGDLSRTAVVGPSSPWGDLVVYPLAAVMPWIGLAFAIAVGFGWLAKYRRAVTGSLVGYVLLFALFAAMVYLR